MAEVLAVAGGIASFGQIVLGFMKIGDSFSQLLKDYRNAPSELARIHQKIAFVQETTTAISNILSAYPVDLQPPPDLRQLLSGALAHVQSRVDAIFLILPRPKRGSSSRFREGLRWVRKEKKAVEALLQHLSESQTALNNVLSVLTYRNSILALHTVHLQKSAPEPEQPHAEVNALANPPGCRRWVLAVDSFLRKLGFYGHFILDSSHPHWTMRLCIGYRAPEWMSSWSVSCGLELTNCTLSIKEFGISITSGYVRIQNRVSIDDEFMTACQCGDVEIVRQSLIDKPWRIRDRTMCLGKTPLLLAISGRHLDIIQLLLDAGADPNIGDDDQVLPVFAVTGLNIRRNKYFPQLPPTWGEWFQVLRLLVDYGASVHADFHSRPLGTFDITYDRLDSKHLEFFRLLRDESYSDFDKCYSWQGRSAPQTAIKANNDVVMGLKLLVKYGVDLRKTSSDGRTFLHMAAELSIEPGVITFLLDTRCEQYIDKQDQWGWTPLHYAIIAEYYDRYASPFEKVEALIQRGARTDVKARYMPHVCPTEFDGEITALELSASLKPSILNGFVQVLKANGRDVPLEFDEEPFEEVGVFESLEYNKLGQAESN